MTRPEPLDARIAALLACPSCRGPLAGPDAAEAELECPACALRYPRTAGGGWDLRPRRHRPAVIEIDLGRRLPAEGEYNSGPLPVAERPEVDFSGTAVPHHLTPELLSHFPRARRPESAMLDLGCGTAIHRGVCERAGFLYVGVDYDAPEAPLWGNAHALPFRDRSFDFVLTIAVLEHIRNPFVMMREVSRVLAPGGRLVGTVAFLEPFHGDSFYHHTHLGTLNTLDSAGLRVEHVSPMVRWNVIAAQAQNGLFPRMPKPLARRMGWPLEALHRAWWRLAIWSGRASEELRLRSLKRTTGAFAFVAHRDDGAGAARGDDA